MNIYFLIITIIFLFIVLVYNNSEYFDEKITNTNKEKCGIMCTKLINCKGFMVEDDGIGGKDNVCYLSKTPILGSPTKSVFANEYKSTTTRCNKYDSYTDTQISDFEKKKNATYICVPNQKDNIQTYKIYDNKEKQIYSLEDLEYINVDPYTFVDIDWDKQINLDDYPKLIQNPNQEEKNTVILMTEHPDEYLGQYLFPHKCVGNISQHDCLQFCINNSDCVGTEYNAVYTPKNDTNSYELHKGVCCPKKEITKYIPRKNEHKSGSFFIKERMNINEISDNIIINFGSKISSSITESIFGFDQT